jgi:hypothetical protein
MRGTSKFDLLQMLPHIMPLLVPGTIRAEDDADADCALDCYGSLGYADMGGLACAAAGGAGLGEVLQLPATVRASPPGGSHGPKAYRLDSNTTIM